MKWWVIVIGWAVYLYVISAGWLEADRLKKLVSQELPSPQQVQSEVDRLMVRDAANPYLQPERTSSSELLRAIEKRNHVFKMNEKADSVRDRSLWVKIYGGIVLLILTPYLIFKS